MVQAIAGTGVAHVLNISSDAAVEAYPGWGGYGSAKAALDQLTAVLDVMKAYYSQRVSWLTWQVKSGEPLTPVELVGLEELRSRMLGELTSLGRGFSSNLTINAPSAPTAPAPVQSRR